MNRRPLLIGAPIMLLAAALLAAGCGGGTSASPSTTAPSQAAPAGTASSATGSAGATTTAAPGSGALTAEAQQTAAGDIPDNQVFLTFTNRGSRYSMKYPEGWARRGAGPRVMFQDKNNLVQVTVASGGSVTVNGIAREMTALKRATPSLRFEKPKAVTVGGTPLVQVAYSTRSAPNAVTGKRVTLVVDRYYVPGAGRHAIVDLGTPQGVDNVDAYRLMIESFRWK